MSGGINRRSNFKVSIWESKFEKSKLELIQQCDTNTREGKYFSLLTGNYNVLDTHSPDIHCGYF